MALLAGRAGAYHLMQLPIKSILIFPGILRSLLRHLRSPLRKTSPHLPVTYPQRDRINGPYPAIGTVYSLFFVLDAGRVVG